MAPGVLPEPKPIPISSADLMLLASANATNGTQPHIVTGVAQSSSTVEDAATNSQAAAQQQNIQTQAESLRQQPVATQQQVWDGLNGSQQAQYKGVGYQPPKPHADSGILGDIGGVVGGLTAAPRALVRDVVEPALKVGPVHDIANAAGSPLRAVQHGVRTLLDLGNQAQEAHGDTTGATISGSNPGQGAAEWSTFIGKVFSLKDWKDAWNETKKGQTFIDPAVRRQVSDQYGPATYNLAYQLATGHTPQQIMAATPQANQTALQQQLQSKDVTAATNALNGGHLSIGRAIVGSKFIAEHPKAGNDLSGALDATFDFFGDPTVIAGNVVSSAMGGYNLVRSSDDVQRLYDTHDGVKTAFQRIAKVVASDDPGRLGSLQRDFPKLNTAADQLVAANADTEQKVLEYFKNNADMANTIEGTPANTVGMPGTKLPTLSPLGAARLAAKGVLQKNIDLAADAPFANLTPAEKAVWDDHDLWQPGTDNPLPSQPAVTGTARLTVGLGRLGRRALTLEPPSGVFNPLAQNATSILRDVGLRFLPRDVVDKAITDFAITPDLGAKWRIYRSLMLQSGHAAGLDQDPATWQRFIGKFAMTDGRAFAPDHIDDFKIDDVSTKAGILKGDMAQQWALPNFKQMYLEGRKVGLTNALAGPINAGVLDKAMQVWRTLTLARIGFATRVGGEEAALFMIRNNAIDYMRAAAGRTLLKTARRAAGQLGDETLDDLADHDAAAEWDRNTQHLPQSVVDKIRTPADLVKTHLADVLRRASAGMAHSLTSDAMEKYTAKLVDHGDYDDIPEQISAIHHPYDSGQPTAQDGSDFLEDDTNSRKVPAELQYTGKYKLFAPTDDRYTQIFYTMLHRTINDDWGREALFQKAPLERADGTKDFSSIGRAIARRNRVADKLQADPTWKLSVRSTGDRTGRLVAHDGISERQAALDHSDAIIRLVDSVTRDATGKSIPVTDDENLADYMLRTGKPPSTAALDLMPRNLLPQAVRGPETAMVGRMASTWLSRASNKLFETVIGPQINWISRQPMYLHEYVEARVAWEPAEARMLNEGMSPETVEDLVHKNAQQRAVDNTIKFVHNPQLRSEMSVLTRNLAPFWFAQEQFYKRWARSFAMNPGGFRKAQLLITGIRHTGLVHTDPTTGQQYFVYPGSGFVQSTLTDFLSHVGIKSSIPVAGALTGQLNMLSPGLQQRVGVPSWGPLLTIPMNGLQSLDPSLHRAVTDVEGPAASSSGFFKAFFPASIAHVMEVADPNLDAAAVASAQIQAIQAIEASGHGLGTPATTPVTSMNIPNPKVGDYVLTGGTVGASAYVYQPDGHWQLNDPHQMQQILDRVKNWARVMLVTRAMFGFSGPASPEIQFDPNGLNSDFRTLLSSGMTVDNATTSFLAEHPNATAETIFSTESAAGGSIPETAAAMQFLDNNPKLVSTHFLSAPFFLPQATTTGPYSQAAYLQQLQDGLRTRKDPSTFYNQVVYQQAANIYYNMENYKYQLLSTHAASTSDIDNQWTQWSEQFMAANPVFASQATTDGPATRQRIMADVAGAIKDGSAPKNAQTTAISLVYNNWALWQQLIGSFGNPGQTTVSTSTALSITEDYAQSLATFVAQNPGVQPLVDKAIRPDLETALSDLADQGVTVNL